MVVRCTRLAGAPACEGAMKPIVFGRYTLIERLGTGGMAEVFLAKTAGSKGLERLVAIKRIHGHLAADRKFTDMFIDEANLAAKLTHANIAQIFDLGKVDEQYFIAMEYVHGRDLRALFRRHQAKRQIIPVAQACYMGLKMCEGLDYAHNRKDYSGQELGLVHRDVSLNNLILSFDGELKIIDFGVAKAVGRSTRTETGFVKGKIAYMSPEQLCRQPIDRRSDVFSCGIVLFEILCGQRLFSVPSLRELVQKVRQADVPGLREVNPNIPVDLEKIVLRALEKEPADRYQSAGDLHDALLDFAQREDFFMTRNQMSSWMRELYREHYEAESARIAALWERSKEIELENSAKEALRDAEDDDDVIPPPTPPPGLDGPTASHGPIQISTQIGWSPPSRSPAPDFSPDQSNSAEVITQVFRPDSETNGKNSESRSESASDPDDLIRGRLPLPSPDKSVDLVPKSSVLPERAEELAFTSPQQISADARVSTSGRTAPLWVIFLLIAILAAAILIMFTI